MFTHEGLESTQHLDAARIQEYERLIGREVACVMWYSSWEDPFPTADCELARRIRKIPHLTWELFWPSRDPANTRSCPPHETGLDDVLAGRYDAYLEQFADRARDWGGKLLLRFLHEFNGDWYTWGGNKNGGAHGGPEKVKRVWRYVVDRFRAAGAGNVRWLWCPHGPTIDRSEQPWNALANYWPGADYVDWHGMDAYNWYPHDPWGNQRPYMNFDDCFGELYQQLLALAPKPICIAEMGSGEFTCGQENKAAWIQQSFARLKADYPWIRMYTWFNIKKERDWRVDSSPESLAAFRAAMQDPYFLSEGEI
ncbi:MAG: hypothetical protein JXB85_15750 [Anaerolineales bacterium]|nr:hypothetical protein [Anaerolineales bacterium]